LPVLGPVPEVALTDQSGARVGLAELRDRVWIADFIFTSCAGICPGMTARMAELQKRLADAPDLRLVSFSVDPGTDTVETLARYGKRHGVDPGRWHLLTGDRAAIHRLSIEGFKLGAGPAPDGGPEPILHSSKLVLVDRAGRIRGYYDTEEESATARVEAGARALLGAPWYRALPHLNAALNATSAVLLLSGWACIRRKRVGAHKALMLSAVVVSLLFLTSYVIYHANAGSKRFPGAGTIRTVYLGILLTHTVLAIALVPLVIVTLRRALRADFVRHKRIAKLTFPVWVYVSVTGVIVYWMLYHGRW
jgi:protein SCO1/2/putative membrane protein